MTAHSKAKASCVLSFATLGHLRQAREFEVQVWVEEFLVQRVVCGYCGAQQKDHSGVYPKST